MQPLCFVLMPFGQKPDSTSAMIDFDAVYEQLIAPSIRQADLDPIRADEEQVGGIIHKQMFERLLLCEYAIADLTGINANVYYELGVRHAVRPHTTVLLFAEKTRLPFDVSFLRAIPYKLGPDGRPTRINEAIDELARRLREAKEHVNDDSPIFNLVEGFPDIQHLKTDVFRDRVRYAEMIKQNLGVARKQGKDALRAIEKELGNIRDQDAAVAVDLFLSYRAVKAWDDMIALVDKMSEPLAAVVMVREQLALALNRAGRGEEAESILLDVLEKRGASSETYGILGRVYKDRWETAENAGERIKAGALLEKAIGAYLRGFEADWRDAYPGVNAVTLMELKNPPDPRRQQLLPVVRYAVERRVAVGEPNYWDFATLLELAVIEKDEPRARSALGNALASVREIWEPETTLRNLSLISKARKRRGETFAWVANMANELSKAAQQT